MGCNLPSARLAQSAERKALNLVVVGSSPTVGVSLPVNVNVRIQHEYSACVPWRRKQRVLPLRWAPRHEVSNFLHTFDLAGKLVKRHLFVCYQHTTHCRPPLAQ